MKEVLVLLKRSIEDEEELEERMLSDMERGTSNPLSRRKQRSMGEREKRSSFFTSGPIHNLPGSSSRREMWDKKQGERDWERWGKRHAEDKAIAGKDLPSYHGFGSDRLREIHPGDNYLSHQEMVKPGKYEFEGTGRENRPIDTDDFGSMDDFVDFLLAGGIEHENEGDTSEPTFDGYKPWTTSGPTNYVPETEEWVDNIFDNTPTFHGIPFNEKTGFTKGYNKELKHTPNSVGAFSEAWDVLKMGFPPSSGPSPLPTPDKLPNGGALNGNGTEEYSHKDLDGESLIDFLIQTLQMDYQDAKVLVNHHKTKEMAGASQRKAKAAAEDAVEGGLEGGLEGGAPPMPPPSMPMMGKPPMGMGKPPMGGPI
tara:strand:+ start:259 stop:1362 length:1104 start_codon:yes stop_codon:yes gene_type:complete